MKKLYTTLVLVLSITLLNAQDYRYGKVSDEEVAEKIHPIDPSADAAVLFRDENIRFIYTTEDGFMQEREVHERIKIYNKEGYNWATKKVFLYKGGSGSNEQLRNVKGYTYNLVNGKTKKDKLRNDGIFEEDYNEYTEINTLTMPNIQDGAVIEYSYKITSPFKEIDDLYFQSTIPINKLNISVATPQFYQYNKLSNLKAFYAPDVNEVQERRTFSSTTSNRGQYNTAGTSFNQSKSEYFDNAIKISEENIPAVKGEAYAGNIDNYLSKMSMELSAVLNEIGVVQQSLSTSWEKVSKTIYDYASFGDQLKKNNFFEDDISTLVGDKSNPFEKSAILFNYVKSKVKWNGNYGFTSHQGIRKAYKEGTGNVGDINLLLIAMLKSQGVQANPVLVSTKNNGIPLFPTRKGFNYVVCLIEHENSYMLLDATELYSAPNVLPERALNWQGRVIKENGVSGWIPLRPSDASAKTTMLNISLNADNSAAGKAIQSITSHAALNYRNRFARMSQEDHIKNMEKDKGVIEISNLVMENEKDIMEPVKVSYEYNLTDALDEVGNNLYFSPLLFLADKESPFKLEKRNYPIDFTTPINEKYLINIKLPENYTVEAMPKNEVIEFNSGLASYSYIGKQNGQYLQFNITFELKNSLVDPVDYEMFKDFYEKIIQKQAEQVVLTKS